MILVLNLVVHFGLHSFFKVRLKLCIFLENLLRSVLQGQGPQDGDARVHHVDLAERIDRHLKE